MARLNRLPPSPEGLLCIFDYLLQGILRIEQRLLSGLLGTDVMLLHGIAFAVWATWSAAILYCHDNVMTLTAPQHS